MDLFGYMENNTPSKFLDGMKGLHKKPILNNIQYTFRILLLRYNLLIHIPLDKFYILQINTCTSNIIVDYYNIKGQLFTQILVYS